MTPTLKLHEEDLPKDITFKNCVAIDTETMGLNVQRDRLCLVQLSEGDGICHLVKISQGQAEAPNLQKLLENPKIIKIFHFARFDVAALWHNLGIITQTIYCTKIASKVGRTYTDRHGLKDLCKDLLGIEISKAQQQTDWGAKTHSDAQLTYAATDVLYLHQLKVLLDEMLKREDRTDFAHRCFDFIIDRVFMDLSGWHGWDLFEH